jgi:deazaflavin-dependent oxidoreductase (nitroreductase family)
VSGPADARAFHAQRIAEFRANGGRLNAPLDPVPLLILTTIGARTGQPGSTIMSYSTDGARLIVVAAKGGAATNPDWYHNLLAHPEVTVELGARPSAPARRSPASRSARGSSPATSPSGRTSPSSSVRPRAGSRSSSWSGSTDATRGEHHRAASCLG